MNQFEKKIQPFPGCLGLCARGIRTLQVNLGFLCNQQCSHCHLQASPERAEMMSWEVMEGILAAADQLENPSFDLTGGAPEMNPNFKRFVSGLRDRDYQVQVRTNLSVFFEPEMEDLPVFFRDNAVQLVASLPCYLEENVYSQRGEGVYQKSISGLKKLNELGYGVNPKMRLSLVYNPGGAFLPPSQEELEMAYRQVLAQRFDISFTDLLTITNMPIGRFFEELREQAQAKEYMSLLKNSFNDATVDHLMCRDQLSIAWDGTLYDCDFNMALGLPVNHGAPNRLEDFDLKKLEGRRIVTGPHCFGCTAGAGSSCGGALVDQCSQPDTGAKG